MKTVIAYHFVGNTLRDGTPVPDNGVWLKHQGKIVMCQSGLHASRHPLDALVYAPGLTLCRVKVRKDINEYDNKLVGRERLITARIDATGLLLKFARKCALDVIGLWDAPEVTVKYLKTGDASLRVAAADAARAAARAAALAARAGAYAAANAARAAALAAAYAADAAAYAALGAARAAALAAAYAADAAYAAGAAALAAAYAALGAAGAAAYAAYAAAYAAYVAANAARGAAARIKQRRRLAYMVRAAFRKAAP
jgi:hypothetical protein